MCRLVVPMTAPSFSSRKKIDAVVDERAPVALAQHVALLVGEARFVEQRLGFGQEALAVRLDQIDAGND